MAPAFCSFIPTNQALFPRQSVVPWFFSGTLRQKPHSFVRSGRESLVVTMSPAFPLRSIPQGTILPFWSRETFRYGEYKNNRPSRSSQALM